MVLYVKEEHVMVRCGHVPLKVNNWSQETCAIMPHIEFEHIEGKENVLADSLSRCFHEGNDPEEPGEECGKSIFDMDENTANRIDNDQNSKLMKDSIF